MRTGAGVGKEWGYNVSGSPFTQTVKSSSRPSFTSQWIIPIFWLTQVWLLVGILLVNSGKQLSAIEKTMMSNYKVHHCTGWTIKFGRSEKLNLCIYLSLLEFLLLCKQKYWCLATSWHLNRHNQPWNEGAGGQENQGVCPPWCWIASGGGGKGRQGGNPHCPVRHHCQKSMPMKSLLTGMQHIVSNWHLTVDFSLSIYISWCITILTVDLVHKV